VLSNEFAIGLLNNITPQSNLTNTTADYFLQLLEKTEFGIDSISISASDVLGSGKTPLVATRRHLSDLSALVPG